MSGDLQGTFGHAQAFRHGPIRLFRSAHERVPQRVEHLPCAVGFVGCLQLAQRGFQQRMRPPLFEQSFRGVVARQSFRKTLLSFSSIQCEGRSAPATFQRLIAIALVGDEVLEGREQE